jgi:hypothetical protein
METMQGISLYSSLHLKLPKIPCVSYYLLFFSLTKSENKMVEQVLPRGGGGGREPKQCTHKCKNIKLKKIIK